MNNTYYNLTQNWKNQTQCVTYITFEIVNWYNWVLFIIGLLGNTLSIIVMNRARMRSSTATLTVTSLAIADILTLFFKLLQSHLKYIEALHYGCFIIEYLTHVCVMVAVWIIIVMTIERALAVWCPLKINGWSIRIILYFLITFIISIFAILNVHYLFAYFPKDKQPWICELKSKYKTSTFILNYYYWLRSLLYSWLPIFILTFTNLMIIYAIHKASRKRQKLILLNSENTTTKPSSYLKSTERQITIMLCCVSITFIALTLPFSIYQLYLRLRLKQSISCFERDLQRISIALADLNHAINFVLYCITGKKFRKEVKRFIKICSTKYLNKDYELAKQDDSNVLSSKYSIRRNNNKNNITEQTKLKTFNKNSVKNNRCSTVASFL